MGSWKNNERPATAQVQNVISAACKRRCFRTEKVETRVCTDGNAECYMMKCSCSCHKMARPRIPEPAKPVVRP